MPEHFSDDRRRFLRTAASTLAAARLGVFGSAATQLSCAAIQFTDEGKLQSLANATAWLNSPALTTPGLLGKVVVVQFWTYTCINWLRTLPYTRVWAEKYEKNGLVVVGVHSPEFAFEKSVENVRRAIKDMNIAYPVAVDSDHTIWNAFSNQYWPALYIADAKGRVRHHQFGEGGYERSEEVIQQLLAEAGATSVDHTHVSLSGRGAEAAADWGNLKSPESYLGYELANGFVSSDSDVFDESRVYAVPTGLKLNQWALAGEWAVQQHAVMLKKPNGRIVYRFHARDVHLVMGPAAKVSAVRFRVRVDGQPPGDAHGTDVDSDGNGTVVDQRLYQLVRQSKPIIDRQFEIEFLDAGVEAFVFTFG